MPPLHTRFATSPAMPKPDVSNPGNFTSCERAGVATENAITGPIRRFCMRSDVAAPAQAARNAATDEPRSPFQPDQGTH